jgi:hypothetical protein
LPNLKGSLASVSAYSPELAAGYLCSERNMSRSYHVTSKQAFAAFCQGDVEPTYQGSEKRWVKQEQIKARTQKRDLTNRSIASAEIARTKRVRNRKEYFPIIPQTEWTSAPISTRDIRI